MNNKFLPIFLLALALSSALPHLSTAKESPHVAGGGPALDREWRGADYSSVAQLIVDRKVALPKLADEQGRALIERLTAAENFSFHRNQTLPLKQRMDDFFLVMDSNNAILGQYRAAGGNGTAVYPELARMHLFALRTAEVGVNLIEEHIPTIPKDEKYSARMEGAKRFHSGFTNMFAGAENTLSETRFYSKGDLSILLATMAETLPTVQKAFSPGYKLELRKKLEAHKSKFPLPEDAKHIQSMIDKLKE